MKLFIMFNFLKNKIYNIKLEPSSKSFTIQKNKNLLSVALENNIDWPFKCRVGSCGTCVCKLLDGKISPEIDFSYVLSQEQIKQGYILACKSSVKSDIRVKVKLKK